MKLNAKETALILIGFQNDYFNKKGALHSVIEKTALKNNIRLKTMVLESQLNITKKFLRFFKHYGQKMMLKVVVWG